MPFAVRKWPSPCDPRTACFCLEGYAFGSVPPFQYRVSTTGALAPYDPLNGSGLLFPHVQFFPLGGCRFEILQAPLQLQIDITPLSLPPYDPPPADTLRWFLRFLSAFPVLAQQGEQRARLPQGVSQPPDVMTLPSGGPNRIPNPVVLLPVPWDAT